MCAQILAPFAIHELTSDAHRQLVMVFDNSTGHAAYEAGALLANHIPLRPGGEQVVLDDFEDGNGNLVHTTFRVGDEIRFTTVIYARKTPGQVEAEKHTQAKKS
ncbi:unnamed protein product, partial [Pylaiella littoralis]